MRTRRALIVLLLLIFSISALCAGCSGSGDETPPPEDGSGTQGPQDSQDTQDPGGSGSTPGPVLPEPDPQPLTFPQDTVILGVDLSGKDLTAGRTALKRMLNRYSLAVSFGEGSAELTSGELGLDVSKDGLSAVLDSLSGGADPADIQEAGLITADEEKTSSAVYSIPGLESTAQDAKLRLNSSTGRYEIVPDVDGYGLDASALLGYVKDAVSTLKKSVDVELPRTTVKARITAGSATAQDALRRANEIFNLSLAYTYSPSTGIPATETLSSGDIAGIMYVKDGLDLAVDSYALNSYVDRMSNLHSVPGPTSRFRTSSGGYLNLNVRASGEFVDTDKLYKDIYYCLTSRVSGVRSASYYTVDANSDSPSANFDGNYVEVDLSAQHLWVYKNGELVVSTPIVSGSVAGGHRTPTGVYTIYDKDTDCYLKGPTWYNFVNYWMAFNGPIGLHDASWRGSFGGDIYLTNGSHGCINMPHSAAATTFANVSVGTHVVVYGGESVVNQEIYGTTSYTVKKGSASFKLDARPRYSTGLTYSSSDPNVASVDGSGTVTPVGVGTAVITVTADDGSGATLKVTVTVEGTPCDINGHSWDSGKVTADPTCTAQGSMTYICTVCGEQKTEPIPATGHKWNEGAVVREAACEEDGLIVYTCTVCGETREDTIPMLGHDFQNGECTRCHKPDPNYQAPGPEDPPVDPPPEEPAPDVPVPPTAAPIIDRRCLAQTRVRR